MTTEAAPIRLQNSPKDAKRRLDSFADKVIFSRRVQGAVDQFASDGRVAAGARRRSVGVLEDFVSCRKIDRASSGKPSRLSGPSSLEYATSRDQRSAWTVVAPEKRRWRAACGDLSSSSRASARPAEAIPAHGGFSTAIFRLGNTVSSFQPTHLTDRDPGFVRPASRRFADHQDVDIGGAWNFRFRCFLASKGVRTAPFPCLPVSRTAFESDRPCTWPARKLSWSQSWDRESGITARPGLARPVHIASNEARQLEESADPLHRSDSGGPVAAVVRPQECSPRPNRWCSYRGGHRENEVRREGTKRKTMAGSASSPRSVRQPAPREDPPSGTRNRRSQGQRGWPISAADPRADQAPSTSFRQEPGRWSFSSGSQDPRDVLAT